MDDEPGIRNTLAMCLEDEGHHVTAAASAVEARDLAASDVYDISFLDLRLGESSGLDLIPLFLEHNPGMGIVVITAYATVETAVDAMKLGAVDYLPKPFEPAEVRMVARKVAERKHLEKEVELLREQLRDAEPEVTLVSESPAMRQVLSLARQVAAGDATVLLQGESGTGKGVLARAIHAWSPRSGGPFGTVHCPSLPTDLFESELFGHARGAFTGAVGPNPGRVAMADRGTLFLDEIADLPLGMQTKLLRFIQDREYERVGDPAVRRADVRIIAATNQDLETAVSEKRFREDLFYRVNVVDIHLPPLRQRAEDVLPLARAFLAFFASKSNRQGLRLSGEAEVALRAHPWPGNVRELQNAVERAVILASGQQVRPEHLSLRTFSSEPDVRVGHPISLQELEQEHIRRVISASRTLEEAATTLGIDPATLWRKRKEYGL